MARIKLPEGDLPESYKIVQVQPAMGNAMAVVSEAIYDKSGLDKRVREAIRMRVAQINQCHICLGFRFPELAEIGITEEFYAAVSDWKTTDLLKENEKLAVEFTELYAQDHLKIDDAMFERLKEYFNDVEIFEIVYTIGALIANGRLMQVLQLEQECKL